VLSHDGSNYAVGWGYDANGSTASLAYPDGASVAYAPDALGRPSQVGTWASAVTHHPNGSIAGYTLANGVAHSVVLNSRNLPRTWIDAGVNDELYDYDAHANVTSITDRLLGSASRTLGYDGLDRLSSAAAPSMWGSATYAYDPLDNLRTSTVGSRSTIHGYDATNRLTLLQTNGIGTALSYDPRGNLAARGGQGFSFDQANRLSSAPGLASYRYDGLGRRVSISGADGSLRIQVYSQAGQLLWGTRRVGSSAATATRYVYLGDRLIAESGPSGIQYVHTDALGSPVARSGASGQVITRTRYEPYGATASGAVPGVGTGSIGFTGHVHDPETALVYMQQRYYDPVAGRFLTVDPMTTDSKTGGHFNRYVYAENNPYKYTDPDGQAPHIVIGAVVGGMAGAIGAMRAPDASIGKLAFATAGGAISGAIAAAAPVTGFAMIKGFAAGATGNVVGQVVASPGQAPSLSQAVAQGAVGAIGGTAGQAAAAYTGIGLASATSQGVGATVATAVSAAINVVMPTDAGGIKASTSPPPASPPPRTPDKQLSQ
jgi:RHS repeat-associated protein